MFSELFASLVSRLPHKTRMALLFSGLVAIILLVTCVITYASYATFRKENFQERLKQQALTTARLLIDVREIDIDILKLIDQNTINKMYDEKVLVFDAHNKLIYSSIDDHKVAYSVDLLERVRREQEIEYTDNLNEVIGLYYNERGQNNVVLASAYDLNGLRKLNTLLYILLIASGVGLGLAGIVSYYYIQQTFRPVELLNEKITRINATNLQEKLPVEKGDDEIIQLAKNFNFMLDRLSFAFETQKNFVQHASHELRTPLATLVSQLEAARQQTLSLTEHETLLASLQEDLDKLTNITNALLTLSRYDKIQLDTDAPLLRIDELVFQAADVVRRHLPEAVVRVDFQQIPEEEHWLSFRGHELTLKTALVNLIENACKYSAESLARVTLDARPQGIVIRFENTGPHLLPEEIQTLFQPFFRGKNSAGKRGFGLGLSIVRRIVELHGGQIKYQTSDSQENTFLLILPK